jgi:hypothetical protein
MLREQPTEGQAYGCCAVHTPGSRTIHLSWMHSAPCCANPALSCAELQCTASHSSSHEKPTPWMAALPSAAPSHASVYGRVRRRARSADKGGATSRTSKCPDAGQHAVTVTDATPSLSPASASTHAHRVCETRQSNESGAVHKVERSLPAGALSTTPPCSSTTPCVQAHASMCVSA